MQQLQQLPLNLSLRHDASFSNFHVASSNQQLVAVVKQMCCNQGEQFLFVWGAAGAGRTHLLQAAANFAADNNLQTLYLPLAQFKNLDVGLLQGLEQLDLLLIDDIQCISGDFKWEEALFNLYNKFRDNNSKLIVVADCPPKNLTAMLPDLQSRLAWSVIIKINELNDDEKMLFLKQSLKQRGLNLTDEVANYILNRCLRNMHDLCNIVDEMDKASLIQQRRLTIPFVKSILNW